MRQRVVQRGRASGWWAPAAGLAGGLLVDHLLGDPRRAHPVAAFGSVAAGSERLLYRDSRLAGALHAGLLVGAVAVAGSCAGRRGAVARGVATAAATWAVVGGTTLRREAGAMSTLLEAQDLSAARRRLSHLCGRDADGLGAQELARATVESLAENTSDAVVGPLLWGALLGVPGLVGYRAVNTLDAMVGHRNDRYLRFGWASARADDVVNLLPARLSAALAALLAPVVDGRPGNAVRAWRRDGDRHPSPNAGRVEAAFAGALGRTLGGPVTYGARIDDRPRLGNGPAPDVRDIDRAARLSGAVCVAAGALAVTTRLLLDGRRR